MCYSTTETVPQIAIHILHQGEVWYEECVTFYSTWPIWFRDLIWSVYFTSRQNLIQSLQGSVSEYRKLTADEIRRFLIRKDVTYVGLRGITVSRRWPRANETLMKCTNWRRRLPITSLSVNQLTNSWDFSLHDIYCLTEFSQEQINLAKKIKTFIERRKKNHQMKKRKQLPNGMGRSLFPQDMLFWK